MLKGIVDRIEGEYVIIEIDGKMTDIHKNLVDPAVQADDVVILKDGKWLPDKEATDARKKYMQTLMEQVWSEE